MFSQDHIFPSRVLQSECGHGYTGRLVPGNFGDTGTEGRLRRPQQETKHGSQMWVFVFFRDWGRGSLCCFPFLYATLLLILKKISAKPDAKANLCSLKLWVAWGGLFNKNTFLCIIFLWLKRGHAPWRKRHCWHGPGQAPKPWQHAQCISESCGHLGRGSQEHELNHPCFRNDMAQMGDL